MATPKTATAKRLASRAAALLTPEGRSCLMGRYSVHYSCRQRGDRHRQTEPQNQQRRKKSRPVVRILTGNGEERKPDCRDARADDERQPRAHTVDETPGPSARAAS